MKTNVNRISINRWIMVIIFNCLLVWRDVFNYEIILGGRKGNLFEFIIFSLNNVYFIVLVGVISVWILVADYKEISGIDILLMIRFRERKEFYKIRMKTQRNKVFIYVLITFVLRFIVAKVMQYQLGDVWIILYEYKEYSFGSIAYLVIKLFVGILGYLCFFVWLRENIGEVANSGFLRNVLPGIIPVVELAIFKSMSWRHLAYLPIGNILLDYQYYEKGILGIGVYWLLMLQILYLIRTELHKKRDYYE